MKIEILGIKINNLGLNAAAEYIMSRVRGLQNTFIVTPNPEMLVLAQGDVEFKNILNAADLAIPDGVGLILAAKFLGQPLAERVSGTDLVQKLIKNYGDELKVFLLGAEGGIGERASAYLKNINPQIKISGIISGGKLGISGEFENQEIILESIRASEANLLLVALGQKNQEKWIYKNLLFLPGVSAIGIGGALDFYAGKVRRAPRWMQKNYLEWFWRLILEPKRIKRIINAVIIFPWLVIKKIANHQ